MLNSFEERLRNPMTNRFEENLRNPVINKFERRLHMNNIGIIDWERLYSEPQLVFDTWLRYKTDVEFYFQVNERIQNDAYFKLMFNKYFASFINSNDKKKVKKI